MDKDPYEHVTLIAKYCDLKTMQDISKDPKYAELVKLVMCLATDNKHTHRQIQCRVFPWVIYYKKQRDMM